MSRRLLIDTYGRVDRATQRAVMLLRSNEPPEGYWGGFSGGKDSIVIKKLAELAKVHVTWHYNVTTLDPPELIYYIRKHHPDVRWEPPPNGNFFIRFETKKTFPNRRFRWCCEEYKERTPIGATSILGIRIAESSKRLSRYTQCVMQDDRPAHSHIKVLPIRLWSDDDVWEFIRWHQLPYCSLYDEGWERLGCVGCPLVKPSIRLAEFAKWPGYERRWRLSFERFWNRMKLKEELTGKVWKVGVRFQTVDCLWDCWVNWKPWPQMPKDSK